MLKPVGDPLTPTYTPTKFPIDHWLLRIPKDTPQPQTTTTTLRTEFSDHNAILAEIPQIGDPCFRSSSVDTYPTTRDHPPFILPILKLRIDLYQTGTDNTRASQQEALLTIQKLLGSDKITTDQLTKRQN